MTPLSQITATIVKKGKVAQTVRVELRVQDQLYEVYEKDFLASTSLERALTNILEIARAEELETPINRDEVEAQIMEDWTRMRLEGHSPITLTLNDLWAHESICDEIFDNPTQECPCDLCTSQ